MDELVRLYLDLGAGIHAVIYPQEAVDREYNVNQALAILSQVEVEILLRWK